MMWWVGRWTKAKKPSAAKPMLQVTQQLGQTHTQPTQQDAPRRGQARRQAGLLAAAVPQATGQG
jgi:hypothetical protein